MKKQLQKLIHRVFASVILLSLSYGTSLADCNEYWDDFNLNRNINSYAYMDGTLNQSSTNPAANFVNSSSTCGKYTRSTTQYDNIVCNAYIGDGDYYRNGRKVFKMDVYSAVPGTIIDLTICSAAQSGNPYPIGRHSVYEATTTKTNEWETLVFVWIGNPDPTVPGETVNQVVIQFAPNTFTTPVYYFDNFVSVFTVVWDDFDYVSPNTYAFSDGSYSEGVPNPAPNLLNSSSSCASYIRNAGSPFDVVVFSATNIGWADDYKAGFYQIKMSVYSPAAGIPVAVTFDKSSVAQVSAFPAGRHSVYAAVTSVANQWEVLTFTLQGSPDPTVGPMEVDELVIQFNPNTATTGTYYFDDFMAVPNTPTIASTITGSATVCQSQSAVTYSVTNVSGSTFNWSVPTGATIVTGAGTNSITVDYSASAVSGYVAVKRINELLCAAPWRSMAVTVNAGHTANANIDQTVCKSATNTTLAGSVGGSATGGTWTTSGTGTFSPNASTLAATYTPSALDKTNGGVNLTLTSSGGSCTPVTDVMILTLTVPTANANSDQTVCSNVSTVALAGSVGGNATGGTWSTSGTGTFSPNASTLAATYNPTVTDKAGSVTLTLTTTGGGCTAGTDQMTITFTAVPTANANIDQTICANISTVSLSGSVGGSATGGTWSTSGTGTFSPNATSLAATYTPSVTDKNNGGATLTLTTSGGCTVATDLLLITINALPTANASIDQSVCTSVANVSLAGSIGGSATGGTWTTTGTGTFTPNATTLTASYTPSTADKNSGNVTLTLTTTGSVCGTSTDPLAITFLSATADAGPDASICSSGPTTVALTAATMGGTAVGVAWTTNGTGTFTPNANTLNATYNASAIDLTGGVILTLTTTGGACPSATDNLLVSVSSTATANAGVDQSICNTLTATLNGFVSGGATGGTWTTAGTGTFSPDATTLAATYNPSSADKTTGSVTLTLTSTGGSCSVGSDQVTITLTTCTGITEIALSEKIQLYPNPTSGMVKIDLSSQDDIVECQLTNSLGVFIKNIPVSKNNTDLLLSTEDLTSGVYYIMFKNASQQLFYKKMIKL